MNETDSIRFKQSNLLTVRTHSGRVSTKLNQCFKNITLNKRIYSLQYNARQIDLRIVLKTIFMETRVGEDLSKHLYETCIGYV